MIITSKIFFWLTGCGHQYVRSLEPYLLFTLPAQRRVNVLTSMSMKKKREGSRSTPHFKTLVAMTLANKHTTVLLIVRMRWLAALPGHINGLV